MSLNERLLNKFVRQEGKTFSVPQLASQLRTTPHTVTKAIHRLRLRGVSIYTIVNASQKIGSPHKVYVYDRPSRKFLTAFKRGDVGAALGALGA